MAKKSKSRAKTAASPKARRASWKGNVVFGLVSIPVEAFNAVNREQSDIHFHQLHAQCHRRIKYQKICPVHGELSPDEIVSGYEYKKGKYVEISDEELDSVKTEQDRALKIDTFVEPTTIDPLYMDGRMYYLLPDGDSARESYGVMVEAMAKTNRYGIGNIVIFGKEQLALVRNLEGVLHMAMLNFEDEIRPPEEVKIAYKKGPHFARQMTLAQTLIKNWFTDKFDFSNYDDEYRGRVEKLIRAKVSGHEVVKPAEEEVEPEVINLMDALKKSMAAKSKPRARAKPAKKTRRKNSA